DQQNPVLEVTTQVRTQNRSVRPGQGSVAPLSEDERKYNLMATALLPVDGLVKETAEGIVRGKTKDVDKAHALYEWVVENTFRNAKVRGCGVGDVSWMIKTGNLNGKCADLNALFVACAARSVCRRAISMASASCRRSSATSRWAPAAPTSPRHSTAAPTSGSPAAAGRRPIRPTCARSCSRSRRPTTR